MSHLRLRLAAFMILGSLGLCSGVVRMQAAESPPPQRNEVVEARTEYSKTFRNGGLATVFVANQPLHYKDTNGAWQEIDTALEPAYGDADVEGQPLAYRCLKNSFASYLPKNGNGWAELRFDQSSLAFKLIGAGNQALSIRGKGEVVGTDVFENGDVSFAVWPGVFKENIILKKRPPLRSLEYLIRLRNLTVRQNQEGDYVFVDGTGKKGLVMSGFVMYDADRAVSHDLEVHLNQQGKTYRLTVIPSQQWLSAPERVYPVTIDPSFTITTDCDSSGGRHNLFYMYIPCTAPSTTWFGTQGSDRVRAINSTSSMNGQIKPYKVHAWYTVHVDNYEGLGFTSNPFFRITDLDPNNPIVPVSATSPPRGTTLVWQQFHNATRNGEFDIVENDACLVEMETGHDVHGLVTQCGFYCWFTVTYQNETMSPPAPAIDPLPAETYGTSVTFSWTAPLDEINPDAPSGTPVSGVAKYFVQRSTDANFTTDVVTTDVGNVTSYAFSGLTTGTTYYFHVYAMDNDRNPLDLTLWDPINNTDGVRWSAITRTKCVTPPPPGGPAKPAISNIANGSLIDLIYHIKDRNPIVSWTPSSSQVQAQLYAVEFPDSPKTFVEYPAYAIQSSASSAQPNNWNLPDGRYVVYVKTANSTSWSAWSDGKLVQIDGTAPATSARNDPPGSGSVNIYLTSNEPVKYDLYWGDNPASLPLHSSTSTYAVHSGTMITISDSDVQTKPHYYKFVCRDKATNTTTTKTICVRRFVESVTAVSQPTPTYEATVRIAEVAESTGYKYYRKKIAADGSAESTICLTTNKTTSTSYVDRALVAHGEYIYGYSSVNAQETESSVTWADSFTTVSPGTPPKVYVPNVIPVTTASGPEPGAHIANASVSFTLGAAKDVENDALLYRLYVRNASGIVTLMDSWSPATNNQVVSVRFAVGDYEWRLCCIEANSLIHDRQEIVLVDWTSLTIEPTSEGELTGDETWSGDKLITGILIVPAGITLTVAPGARVLVVPGGGMIVCGRLTADGTSGVITFACQGEAWDTWEGIGFEGQGQGYIKGATISHAYRGITCTGSCTVTVIDSRLEQNNTGLHCHGGGITVDGCEFRFNTVYGIKEDNGCSPLVLNSIFQGNGIGYYDEVLTEMTVDELNAMPGNGGNVWQ